MTLCPRCGEDHSLGSDECPVAVVPFVDDPLRDTLLDDKYRLLELLGQGGMGRVYLAEDTHLERRVAVKILAEHLVTNAMFVSRFNREAKAVAATGHPNIIQVYDFGKTEDGRPFMVMEPLEGCDLAALLRKKKKLSIARSVDIAGQVLFALAAAHGAGIVHRDLKPGNIFLTKRSVSSWSDLSAGRPESADTVKVLDFGISRFMGGTTGGPNLTSTGMILGTSYYMAPEQATPRQKVDGRADLYAVGAILHLCLTGAHPFRGGNLHTVLHRVLTEEPQDPRELDPAIPEELAKIILKALSKKRDDRFATADEFVVALRPFHESTAGDTEASGIPVAPEVRPSVQDEPPTIELDSAPGASAGVHQELTEPMLEPPSGEEPAPQIEPQPEDSGVPTPAAEAVGETVPLAEDVPVVPAAEEPPGGDGSPSAPLQSAEPQPDLIQAEEPEASGKIVQTPSVWTVEAPAKRGRLAKGAAVAGAVVLGLLLLGYLGFRGLQPTPPPQAGNAGSAAKTVRPAAASLAKTASPHAAAGSGGHGGDAQPSQGTPPPDSARAEVDQRVAAALAKAEVCVARNDMECCVHALDGAPRTARLERVLEACRAKLQPQKRASTAAAKAVTKAVRPTPVRPAAKTGRSPRTAKSSSGAKRSHIVREVPWD